VDVGGLEPGEVAALGLCAELACIGVRPPNASLDWRTGQSGVCGMARPSSTRRPRRFDGPVSCP